MSHEFESGFSVRQPAWHGLGNVLDEYPENWSDARKAAGLEWNPVSEPIYALNGIDGEGNPRFEKIEGYNRIARSDTGATLGVPTETYTTIDHTEMGVIVEALADQDNVRFETAGSLKGGKITWALARLDEPVTIPGDISVTYPYLALLNRHDGKGACKVLPTSIRVVCWNTYSAAEAQGQRSGACFSFVHGKNWKNRIEEARAAVRGARDAHKQYIELATELIGVKVTKKQRELFIAEFLPAPPESLISDRVAKNIDEARGAMREIFASETTRPVQNTAYGLVQAAGEYLDHYRGARNLESYSHRQLLKPQALKTKAVKLALAAANA